MFMMPTRKVQAVDVDVSSITPTDIANCDRITIGGYCNQPNSIITFYLLPFSHGFPLGSSTPFTLKSANTPFATISGDKVYAGIPTDVSQNMPIQILGDTLYLFVAQISIVAPNYWILNTEIGVPPGVTKS